MESGKRAHSNRESEPMHDTDWYHWLSPSKEAAMENARMENARVRNLAILGAALCWVGVQPASGESSDATQLLAKYNCQACHSLDKQVVGPAFKDVAAKYAGDTEAPAKLAKKIKSGGSGVWGATPMPPSNVPDADLEMLVSWILAQK